MKKQDREKTRERLEGELKEYRKLSRVHQSGRPWLREMRQALGMSVTELACRLGCSRSLVYRIEEGEEDGEDRVELLTQVAEAMDCKLIYAIVPENGQTLDETADWLKQNPQWRTEKQEGRERKEEDALRERLTREHWELVRKQREERAQARRRAEEAEKMAEEWAAEKAQAAAGGAAGNGAGGEGQPPAEWWTARTAEKMQKQDVPGDWALKAALAHLGARKEKAGSGGTEGSQSGAHGSQVSKSTGPSIPPRAGTPPQVKGPVPGSPGSGAPPSR